MNLNYDFANEWLGKLRTFWQNKDVEGASNLFAKTTYYQETPFMKPFTSFEEIKKEWRYIENQEIRKIEFTILAIEQNTMIVEWLFERDVKVFDGIYEIRFNEELECVYFRSWEMEKCKKERDL